MQPSADDRERRNGELPDPACAPAGFQEAFTQLLRSYAIDTRLDVNVAASLCNMSKRSLQRRLAECGTTYSRALARARFEVASELLADPEHQIIDIASRLGYRDASNFSRAFRCFAGVSPRDYRRHALAPAPDGSRADPALQ
jgi:AraC-like DNA-binding protein